MALALEAKKRVRLVVRGFFEHAKVRTDLGSTEATNAIQNVSKSQKTVTWTAHGGGYVWYVPLPTDNRATHITLEILRETPGTGEFVEVRLVALSSYYLHKCLLPIGNILTF